MSSENFSDTPLSIKDKLANFTRFVSRRDIAKFLNRYEIFKRVLKVQGSIIDCGINQGSSLFAWYHFSQILEPYNYKRKIIGFDSFEGFTGVDGKDEGSLYENPEDWKEFTDLQDYESIQSSIRYREEDALLKIENTISIVKGDASKSIPKFFTENKHVIVSLLHIDFDIYKPTKVALETILPRMHKGSVIAFDEINDSNAVGETVALLESLDINEFHIERNEFDSNLSFLTL